jgi:hypothetical protein
MKKETKTQVLTVSKRFLAWHPKAGQPTYFKEEVLIGQSMTNMVPSNLRSTLFAKLHTIRDNCPYWESVFERGMKLSVRQWIDKPYKKPGQEKVFDIEPGLWGIQKITLINGQNGLEAFVGDKGIDIEMLAANDGLSRDDFEAWFSTYFKRGNVFYGVIVHFTDFRY